MISSALLCLQKTSPTAQHWRFDFPSALVGAAAALLLIGLAYVFRDPLRRGWAALVAALVRLYHYFEAGAEENYRESVAAYARSVVVPAHAAALDSIFVEPKLLAPPPSPNSISSSESVAVGFQVLSLRQILGGHPQLAILGAPGTGRTALLAYLALKCATIVGKGDETMPESAQGRLPLYVLLPAMDWDKIDQEGEQKGSGVERLVGAAVASVGGGGGLANPLRQYLKAGRAVVLADGWDELLPQQRQRAVAWLVELVGTLPGNLWLVAAGTRGYASLTEAGFVPLTLASWNTGQVETFANRWVEAQAPADETVPVPSTELATGLQRAARTGATPLELALRAFVVLADRQAPAGRAALFERALELSLRQGQEQGEGPWLPVTGRATLGRVALDLQQGERATVGREEIEAAIEAALPPPEERPARAAATVFRVLTGERGLLRPAGSNRYAFAHLLWQEYLAARQLVAVAPTDLIERLEDPRWANVLRFYAELGDMGPLVAAWLRTPDDIFYTRLRALSSWVGVAPADAAWRDGAMAVLARAFLQSDLLPPTRRALAQALAMASIPGVVYFFKQALQHPDAEVRIATVLGLARVAGESDVAALGMALGDKDPAVRETAVRALAFPGIDAARRILERVLLEGDEALRLVAAETLAQCGKAGEDFLRETAESEDMMARRAAVVGLALVRARDVLEKAAREDGQWIVRSAAAAALDEMEKQGKVSGVAPPPEIEQLPWLISWAATLGEGVGLGEAAQHMLQRALSAGDESVRLAATHVLMQVGGPNDVGPLRAALVDPDPDVASAAFEALAEISRRYDLRIERVDK